MKPWPCAVINKGQSRNATNIPRREPDPFLWFVFVWHFIYVFQPTYSSYTTSIEMQEHKKHTWSLTGYCKILTLHLFESCRSYMCEWVKVYTSKITPLCNSPPAASVSHRSMHLPKQFCSVLCRQIHMMFLSALASKETLMGWLWLGTPARRIG